jgi:hypothetical protein
MNYPLLNGLFSMVLSRGYWMRCVKGNAGGWEQDSLLEYRNPLSELRTLHSAKPLSNQIMTHLEVSTETYYQLVTWKHVRRVINESAGINQTNQSIGNHFLRRTALSTGKQNLVHCSLVSS